MLLKSSVADYWSLVSSKRVSERSQTRTLDASQRDRTGRVESQALPQHHRSQIEGRRRRNAVADSVMTALAAFATIWLDILAPSRQEQDHVLDRWRRDMPVRFWTVFCGSAVLAGVAAGVLLTR